MWLRINIDDYYIINGLLSAATAVAKPYTEEGVKLTSTLISG